MQHYVHTVLLGMLLVLGTSSVFAQHQPCGTPSPSTEQIRYSIDHISQIAVPRNSGTTGIPIQIHIVQDGGSGGPSLENLAKALANLNAYYAEANIEFFYKAFPNYASDTDLYEFNADTNDTDLDTEADVRALFTTATDAVNIYFVNSIVTSSGFGACGYASFPYNGALSNRIMMDNDCLLNGTTGTFVHEFGHYFSLYHTHQDTENGPDAPDAENVARSGANANCSIAGDLLCDTNADPRYDNANFNSGTCTVPNPGMDENGETYDPPVENIMSYYPDGCGEPYTAEQNTRMAQALIVRQGHTAYSIDASPMSVDAPTGLSAVLDEANSKMDLSWTDEANNEMGYIVERSSTSSTTGFRAVENTGTGPDASSVSDNTIEANNTYWYRVKAVNGDKDTYSNVVEVVVGLIYCSVSATQCDEFISRVQIGNIDNSSSCTDGGYQNYTTESTMVEQLSTYPITVTNGRPYADDECGIFVDWNHDGDFDDTDEVISVSGSPGAGPYTANITPPANAELGATRMRIRITWSQSAEPCTNDQFGETEDYVLDVQAVLPVEWLSFTGKTAEQHIALDWVTASEFDNAYFQLQRLTPEKQDFESLAQIDTKGAADHQQDYHWKDYTPLIGTNYYRIKQVDYDGSFSYSKTIAVDWKGETLLQLYPNPVDNKLSLRLNNVWTEDTQVIISNSLGQIQQQISPTPGEYDQRIDVSALESGLYFLQVINDRGVVAGQWFSKH